DVMAAGDVGDGVGTRKIESGRPPAAEPEAAERGARGSTGSSDGTRHSENGPRPRGGAETHGRAEPRGGAETHEIETVATRPIESGPREERERAPAEPRRRSVVWLGVAGAVAGAVGAFFLGKGAALVTRPAPAAPESVTATARVIATGGRAATSAGSGTSAGSATSADS